MNRKEKRKHRKKDIYVASESVTVNVRCNGKLHQIIWNSERQKLQFPDHPDLKKEKILANFGNACRCLKVMEYWKAGNYYNLPVGLREAAKKVTRTGFLRQKRRNREKGKKWPLIDFANFITHPYSRGNDKYINKCANKVMVTLRRIAMLKHLQDNEQIASIVVRFGAPFVFIDSFKRSRDYGSATISSQKYLVNKYAIPSPSNTLTITLPVNWYNSVYNRGLAFVDNKLILLAHKPEDEKAYEQHAYYRQDKKKINQTNLAAKSSWELINRTIHFWHYVLIESSPHSRFIRLCAELRKYGFFGIAVNLLNQALVVPDLETIEPVLITHDHKRAIDLNSLQAGLHSAIDSNDDLLLELRRIYTYGFSWYHTRR